MKFLVALDGSANAQRALEHALDRLVQVDRGDSVVLFVVHHVDRERDEAARVALSQAHESCGVRRVRTALVEHGADKASSTRELLLVAIDDVHADVVVVGRRGVSRLAKATGLGSIADFVVQHSPRTVVVVR